MNVFCSASRFFIAFWLAMAVGIPAARPQTALNYYSAPSIAALKSLTTRPAVVEVVDDDPGIFNWSTTPCSAADDTFQVTPTSGPTGCYTRMGTPYALGRSATANGVAVTNGSGRPSISTTLPAVTANAPLVTAAGATTARSLSARFADSVNVLDYGADPTGASNSTAAFSAALAVGGNLFIPCGTYSINLTVAAFNKTVEGNGFCTILQPFVAGDVITISGPANFSYYRNFFIRPNGKASGSGIVINNGAGNINLEGVSIFDMPEYGVKCAGTPGVQLSGNNIVLGNFLGNVLGNVSFEYCNDFRISLSQMGRTPSNVSAFGIKAVNSGAGRIEQNFIWENTVNVVHDGSHYGFFTNNRLTDSRQENFKSSGSQYLTFTGNQVYSASQSSVGTYNQATFVGVAFLNMTGNTFYDWHGVNSSPYSVTVDATSSRGVIKANVFNNYATGPIQISPSAFQFSANDNNPPANAYSNNVVSATWGFVSGSTGGGGVTVYLGNGGASAVEGSVIYRPSTAGTIQCFNVITTAAPGAAQSYTYTLRKNGADTGLTVTQSGAAAFAASVCGNQTNSVPFGANDNITLKVVSSAGAAAASFNYQIAYGQ